MRRSKFRDVDLSHAIWHKSTHSGHQSDCVEVAYTSWRKSSHSGHQTDCIEVADGFTGLMPVRDSKNPQGPTLLFEAGAWSAFITGLKAGSLPDAN
ncbi:DUF397 domain-containing protein [Streptomyces syringium]|uniref:DUF397 domain-containing protein n=1 Tax=Streptomyces syringium TaxID=76729 RepID=UPI0033C3278F